jgi:hypothetical protein
MNTETAKKIADAICNLFNVEDNDSETFFEVYDIIRDILFTEEGTSIDIA